MECAYTTDIGIALIVKRSVSKVLYPMFNESDNARTWKTWPAGRLRSLDYLVGVDSWISAKRNLSQGDRNHDSSRVDEIQIDFRI